jgi:multidrug transporter EmrE-like cation transporter
MALVNVLAMSCAELFGNCHLKFFAESGNSTKHNLAFGIIGYAAVLFFLVRSFNHANMLYVSALWEGMITILGAAVAFFILGERFKHPIQWVGLVLACVAVLMVHFGERLARGSGVH